jgi:hypothetical protein
MRSMILLFLSCAIASSGAITALGQTTVPPSSGNHPYVSGHKLASATNASANHAGHTSSRRTLRREGLTRNPASCVKYGCIGNN